MLSKLRRGDVWFLGSLAWHIYLEFMAPVLSASNFSLPLPSWLQPLSTRVHQYDQYDRKRKKSDDWTDEETDGADTTDAASVTDSIHAGRSLILTPNESHQYRIAGLPFDQELPGGHFPHGPAKEAVGYTIKENVPSQLFEDLSFLNPPIFAPQAAAHRGNLRLQHLGVLSSILHRSLLRGDYIRAGRAWGLILREEFRGIPVDVRSEGRWGIGAEILLRRDQAETPKETRRSSPNIANGRVNPSFQFTQDGFTRAKEYYERLILNHPYSKTAPHAICALHFYPAMFGLWVYVVQGRSKIAMRNSNGHEETSDEPFDEEDTSTESDLESSKRNSLIASIKAQELEQAQQIATRMDQILGSPPYSDSPELLELRGMVSLWIGDLLVSSLPILPEARDNDDIDAMETDDMVGSFETRRAYRQAMERRQAEVQKSKEFLEKAQERGRSVSYSLEHLHIDDGSPFGGYEL